MVVITVMALIAGAVVMTIGSRGADASDAASRFASRVAAARDEAVVGGRPIAVWVTPSGYGFERYGDAHWQPLEAKPFEGRDWGKGLTANAANARSRVAFDTVGLPDSGLAATIGDGSQNATVRLAPNGDVAVE